LGIIRTFTILEGATVDFFCLLIFALAQCSCIATDNIIDLCNIINFVHSHHVLAVL